MKTFPDKGISQINYNFLNLPQNIIQNSNSTNYLYRADGTKVSKSFTLKGTTIDTDYLDGFVYTSTYTKPCCAFNDKKPRFLKFASR